MRRRREQKIGYVYPDRKRGYWRLQYRVDRVIDGKLRRVKLKRDLGLLTGPERLTRKRAQEEAREFLKTLNGTGLQPGTAVTFGHFVEHVYLPALKMRDLRPSTVRGYEVIWNTQLKPYCNDFFLREVRTSTMQALLDQLAQTGRFNKNSLKHIKSFLSGVLRLAIQQEYYPGSTNPLQQTSIPAARPAQETYAYSLVEINAMLAALPEPAATIVATAAYTGARRGELRGMRWENCTPGKPGESGEMMIAQSVWKKHITEPKSAKSKAPIPIIRQLAARLEFHRERMGKPTTGPIFSNNAKNPIDLNNLLGRVIMPVLNRCAHCRKPQGECNQEPVHQYERDSSLPEWHGWHAFRRGLATNLYRLGVPDKTIQRILRHANVATTQNVYIKTVDADARGAMERLEKVLESRASITPLESPQKRPVLKPLLPV